MRTVLALLAALVASPALAEGDADKGRIVYRKCMVCHSLNEGANRQGPSLHNIVGRPVAAVDGYTYSDALVAAGEEGRVWDDELLRDYLYNPRQAFPGTRMIFAGLRKDQDLADIIAYLKAEGEK
ncbi:c-type cytochrome [Falsirhodobacter deserti]|uniref:c-type cytochrome n=1 Tax=Falsirhodobacter deserti TaxID=1365611 RepID=UPI000FE32F65|nr:cytochrome c family protein [Falsirhodobacter deserti]